MPGAWVNDAVCRDMGDASFFPPDDKPVTRDFYQRAREICKPCPVRAECLLYGLDEVYGVWGGLSPVARKTLRAEIAEGRPGVERRYPREEVELDPGYPGVR